MLEFCRTNRLKSLAALRGYISNYVPCSGTRFSADVGGHPAACRLEARIAGKGARYAPIDSRTHAPLPPAQATPIASCPGGVNTRGHRRSGEARLSRA